MGIFTSQKTAEDAAERLYSLGIPREHVNFLIPGASARPSAEVPTTETEQPGMATAIGSVAGGAAGAAGGMMSAAVLSAIIPGIGPVMAVGLTALSLVGAAGGALAGAVAGSALENAMSSGLPKDEIFLYEDALRQGRTVLIVLTEDVTEAETVRRRCPRPGRRVLMRHAMRGGLVYAMLKPKPIPRKVAILRRMRTSIAAASGPLSETKSQANATKRPPMIYRPIMPMSIPARRFATAMNVGTLTIPECLPRSATPEPHASRGHGRVRYTIAPQSSDCH